MLNKLDNFLYKKIIRGLMFTSWLGRRVVIGHADSAMNFAHIYNNKAKGYVFFGKVVDRILLNLPSARATRNRKDNISKIIKAEINNNIKNNKKTRIVDIASGPGHQLGNVLNSIIDIKVLIGGYSIGEDAVASIGENLRMAKKILVIDDEELVTKSIMRLLEKEGYGVVIAKSGKEAINKVKEADFDLIVSDVRMPDLGGIETVQHIRDYLKKVAKKAIPEVLITGYADLGKYNTATKLKVADYIYKPFDMADFLKAVKKNIS